MYQAMVEDPVLSARGRAHGGHAVDSDSHTDSDSEGSVTSDSTVDLPVSATPSDALSGPGLGRGTASRGQDPRARAPPSPGLL
jgi:hypothetical protein